MQTKTSDLLNSEALVISDGTVKEIAKFFMKTSIPRILADMAKMEGEPSEKNISC